VFVACSHQRWARLAQQWRDSPLSDTPKRPLSDALPLPRA
jgi:hypothetical protein